MNTICCNNCKISINYNNGISYQSHYLSLSVSFPRNVRALALKCQNIPQKSQVHNCFSQNKKRFWKKLQFRYQERSIWLSLPISNVDWFWQWSNWWQVRNYLSMFNRSHIFILIWGRMHKQREIKRGIKFNKIKENNKYD